LNHFLPGTPILSFGTAGCNLACKFCQNWDISKSREMDRLMDQATPGTIARAAQALGCRSVAYTYNDPVIFHEYAVDVSRECRKAGIHSVAVTAGYVNPEPREEFYRHMDAANIDLKGFSDDFYRKLAAGRLDPVKDTIRYVCNETDVWVELTTLLIPGWNDTEADLRNMSDWIVDSVGPDVPLHFTAFHPDWRLKDVPATPLATLTRARDTALERGIRFVYTGNVHNKSSGSTYCPECGEMVIGRDWYVLSEWNLTDHGSCAACGAEVPGVFEARPGVWGAQRRPVRLADYS
jgi:pyruvate formate lyase activating enzyme